MEPIEFGNLTGLTVADSKTPGSMAWTLTDSAGRQASFEVDGSGVGLVFQTLIGLLQKIAESQPPENGATALGALPAQNISITAGRHPKEVSLHIHIGRVDLAYLVPLDSIVINMGELLTKLYQDPPNVPTH